VAGPWRHATPPAEVPAWLAGTAGGFRGVVAVPAPGAPGEWLIVMRAVSPTRDHTRAVVADLPVDPQVVTDIEARTQTRMGQAAVSVRCGGASDSAPPQESRGLATLFRRTVAFLDCTNWQTGEPGFVTVALDAPVDRLYGRVGALHAVQVGGVSPNNFLQIVVMLAVLFLVIQGSALVMGALLARSITYAVHELFVGTERVQQGDFTHRIRIDTGDQLGDLAGSFNRMSSSIEHLLHVQREKQRLDDELRIAREIQKSLLPIAPPAMAGMTIADLCEPAREVGGDYYDFFELSPRRLGVMVADVSGKGTSAALYMAELKGLMLALTRKEESPRRLLIEANRLLSEHLDNRSFITMTYAIIDLETRTLTCARAGHTPLIVVSGGRSHVICPSGMVLGLRLPGAAERFAEVLEEHTRPLAAGDVIVLYTDGITEAMNADGDLFSDEALGRVVEGQDDQDAAGIRERVVREVRAFVGDAEPHDDMTMIVLKVD
jgi:sigma-B regulation protein RsbU (phosphoserine phosphatase)